MDNFVVLSCTHWDREWYRTYNDFRIRLCDVFNQVLYLLDTCSDFNCYTFDGQTIVLEDYLEIYPENHEKVKEYIKKYIKSGRISGGPWYVIPDEFLPSDEGTITENLRDPLENRLNLLIYKEHKGFTFLPKR